MPCEWERQKNCGCVPRVVKPRTPRPPRPRPQPSEQMLARRRTYDSWANMRKRVNNPSDPSYKRYGGRGITICERWQNSFINFLADMGPRPKSLTLERIDNDGPYSPDNCKWDTRANQVRNCRNNVWLTYQGETLCITDWSRRYAFNVTTARQRLRRGWTIEEVFTGRRLHASPLTTRNS